MANCEPAKLFPPAPLLPLEAFFADPERTSAKVAPDGQQVAFLAPDNGHLNLWVCLLGGDGERCVTREHERSIRSFWWLPDGCRLVYLQDRGGDENFHLFVVDVARPGGPGRDLTPLAGVKAELLAVPPARPYRVVAALNARRSDVFDAWRIDVDTGAMELVAENPGTVTAWIPDDRGRVLAAYEALDGGDFRLLVRDDESAPFRELRSFASEDLGFPVPGRAPLSGIAAGTGRLWLGCADGNDRLRLVELDPHTGTGSVVDADDEADLAAVVANDHTGQLLGTRYVRDRVVTRALDPRFQAAIDRMDTDVLGDPVAFSTDAAARVWAVTCTHDRDAGSTYVVDTEGEGARLLFRSRPWLEPSTLAAMEPVSIRARDGLRLRSYLTLPSGSEPHMLPFVLVVHGGPWGRDQWGFNPEAQFLANRGYGVLQVNYRGSTGFGKAFMQAAIGEFGRAMNDDLLDAAAWAVGHGYADPARLAIYGCSYGGYAALVAATSAPGTFAAAISFAGPSNLVSLIRSFPAYWAPLLASTWFRYAGDPGPADRPNVRVVEDLLDRSPLTRAGEACCPLLVLQGANDPRVPRSESDQLVEALVAHGLDVAYLVRDDEGHGFAKPENRLAAYRAIEGFLASHLGGRPSG